MGSLYGQQVPQSSHYLFHQLWMNPGYAGVNGVLQLDASARGQWVNLEGAPVSQWLSAQIPAPLFDGGLGINLANDLAGAERTTLLQFSIARNLIKRNYLLRVGVSAGILQKSLDGSRLITPEGSYTDVINHADPVLSNGRNSGFSPDAGIGLYIRSRRFAGGLAVQHLLGLPVSVSGSEDLQIGNNRHFIIYGSYTIPITYDIAVRPNIYAKSDLVGLQVELGALFSYNNRFLFGPAVRGYNNSSLDSFLAILAFRPNTELTIAYSYDHTISRLGRYDIGSHEISVSYRLASVLKAKNSKTIYNPRFL